MADFATSIDTSRWTSAHHNYRVALLAWSAVDLEDECHARDHAAKNLVDARSLLFAAPAPTISQVIEKLQIWWGEALFADTYEMSQHRMLVGDLRRLQLEAVGATELEASGRSSEEASMHADSWRVALADYDEEERLFVEGPSPRWQGREAIELVDAMDAAASTLLGLPAPTLGGVLRKIELLWETDRYDTIEAGAFYHYLILDLNRFAREARGWASDLA